VMMMRKMLLSFKPSVYKNIYAGVKIFEHICLDNSGDEAFLLTTKHVAWKSAVAEIAWIYIMQSNVVQDLRDMNCKVWNEFEKEDGTIGPSYGEIVKRPVFDYKNQLEYVIETIKKDPNSRRIMIDLWSVPDLKDMALTPCCYNSIFNVQNGKLYMQLNIRSSDVALGLPFNVFQFQVLHKLIAHECNLEPADMYVVIAKRQKIQNYIITAILQTPEEYSSKSDLKAVIDLAIEEGEKYLK